MNAYAMAFAIGYYYGRAYGGIANVTLPEHDIYHKNNQGFSDGLVAGRRDFQEIDLPILAMEQPHVDNYSIPFDNSGSMKPGDVVAFIDELNKVKEKE